MARTPRRRFQTLRAYRDAKGLTQREAAKQFDITQAAWCAYENGTRRPRAPLVQRLAAVGIDPVSLLLNGPKAVVLAALWAGAT